ncbi:MAG: dTMP kinase [Candidatus Nanopelagicales bacterium]|jgi:dTMP kinase
MSGSSPGYFVAFEGGEGAGKSTQERLLAETLVAAGHDVVRTREPGGTPAAEAMRHVVLSPEFAGLDDRAEALLYAAARGEHVARVVRPALSRGAVVVCDRYLDSSVAYQGYGRGLGPDRIRDLSLWATGGLLPDLSVLLDVDPRQGLARFEQRDRLEAEPVEFHDRVRAGFREVAAANPDRYLVLDAALPVGEIADRIADRVLADLRDRA